MERGPRRMPPPAARVHAGDGPGTCHMDNATQASAPTGSRPPAAPPDLTGHTLGDFRVLRRLGQGGMGQVYVAEQISLKRKVALKILRADLAADPTALERFKREAEAVARATHANIVQVYAFGSVAGLWYMALEYVEGKNLKEFVAKKGPPDAFLALGLMRQVAAALSRAAELGIIHRDIKPENILLTRKGEVKVADFGLSRCLEGDQPALSLTQSGVTMGTPLYMSPEQVEGKPLDPRTDIYSFGVTCYHLLTGQPPFRGQTAFEVSLKHVQEEPAPLQSVRPDLPAELCALVHRMMAKKPDDRYQTARELLKEIARVREALMASATQVVSRPAVTAPAPAAPTPPAGTPAPARRRGLPWAAAASLLLAGGLGFAGGWLRHHARAPSGPPPAEVRALDDMFAPQKREQFLKEAVEQYMNPGNDPNKVRLGMGHCMELGLLYLEQWRLDEAGQLFARLEQHPNDAYKLLGRLGQGIVLALQDRPEESNALFLKLQADGRQRLRLFLAGNPQLHQWVARA